jgi:hypothetical protein
MNQWLLACAIAIHAGACSLSAGPDAGPAAQTLAEFESQLDRLRTQLAIPGMSAIVMVHDAVVWEGSLGIADIPSQRPVTPATQFHLASLTKTFASTIVLQLVEQGLVHLDDPISNYGLSLPGPGVIRVRHLMSHTSEGVPGDQFRYNGDRFALLDQVIAVIGEGEFLFADRGGALYHYAGGGVIRVPGLPLSRTSGVYGGLLDVSLHPSFADSRLVYIAYNDASFGLTIARFELRDDRAENLSVIFESDEFSIGSRMEWQDSSHFFLSFGVGGNPFPAPGPQDLSADVGKIHRLTADGQIPRDNPIFPGTSNPTTIWSYGHRNPQGLHYDVLARRLYATEHGPLGGDELNIVLAGGNYGWPLSSYGLNYDRTTVTTSCVTIPRRM